MALQLLSLQLLLLSVVSLLSLTASDGRREEEGGGAFVLSPELVANGLRIVDLERKLEILREKLEAAESVDPQRDINELLARVVDLEGSHCREGEFQCGGSEQECVSDLLVCDGHRDCHNRHDEDEEVCQFTPIRAGNIFSGISVWSDCRRRNDHVTRFVITQTQHRKYFRSRVFVNAHVTSYLEENGRKRASEFAAKGAYNFATRRLSLVPADDADSDHLPVVCHFNYGDDVRATCRRTLVGNDECAHLDVALQHHHGCKHTHSK